MRIFVAIFSDSASKEIKMPRLFFILMLSREPYACKEMKVTLRLSPKRIKGYSLSRFRMCAHILLNPAPPRGGRFSFFIIFVATHRDCGFGAKAFPHTNCTRPGGSLLSAPTGLGEDEGRFQLCSQLESREQGFSCPREPKPQQNHLFCLLMF